jgi:hypothetical protein
MADVSLVAVPRESDAPTCANCGAELVAEQRYCLACGHPVSPVRLAFLDVLQENPPRAGQELERGMVRVAPLAYAPVEERGLGGWLHRNAGILGLLAVLLLCLIAGLLVGHWVTQNNKAAAVPGTQTIKVEGLGALAGAGTSTSSPPVGSSSAAKTAGANSTAKEEAAEAKEAAEEEAKPKAAPKAVTLSKQKVQKLNSSHGKQKEEEINSLGSAPIETH